MNSSTHNGNENKWSYWCIPKSFCKDVIIGHADDIIFISKCLDDNVKEQHEYKFKIESLKK